MAELIQFDQQTRHLQALFALVCKLVHFSFILLSIVDGERGQIGKQHTLVALLGIQAVAWVRFLDWLGGKCGKIVDGKVCDASSVILAAQETALLVSLKLELLPALGQCRLCFCSQEESLVSFQNQVA